MSIREIQEWLCLRGIPVQIDGQLGPETELALSLYGVTGVDALHTLSAPMKTALTRCASVNPRDAIVSAAVRHLMAGAREVGGANRGPWVRLYCGGMDGLEYKWCAGFAGFVLRQANVANALGDGLRDWRSLSCDEWAQAAALHGRLVPSEGHAAEPGDVALFRARTHHIKRDWIHAAVVVRHEGDKLTTIDGNSNSDGSPDGNAVVWKVRRGVTFDIVKTV